MSGDYLVPYADGNMLHYPLPYNAQYEWRKNKPFIAMMRLDGMESGRSAKYVWWRDEQGHRFPMFITDLVEMLNKEFIVYGRTKPLLWKARKRGQNYGLVLAR